MQFFVGCLDGKTKSYRGVYAAVSKTPKKRKSVVFLKKTTDFFCIFVLIESQNLMEDVEKQQNCLIMPLYRSSFDLTNVDVLFFSADFYCVFVNSRDGK